MPPPLFADLFKTSNDLFVKDYKDLSPKLESTVAAPNGVTIKTTFTQKEKEFASELELKRKIYEFDVTGKLTAKKERSVTIENSTLIPNLKFKLENYLTKVSGEYKLKQFTSSGSYDFSSNTGDITVVAQRAGLSIGVSQGYGKASSKPSKEGETKPDPKTIKSGLLVPHFKAQYNADNVEVGVNVENYGSKIGLSVYQNVNSTLGVGVNVAQDGSDLALALGGAFVPDKDTSLRGKVDSAGVISALYTQKICPSATLKVLGQVNTQKLGDGAAHKFGLNLLLKV